MTKEILLFIKIVTNNNAASINSIIYWGCLIIVLKYMLLNIKRTEILDLIAGQTEPCCVLNYSEGLC